MKHILIIVLACVAMVANAHQWICENGQWHPVNMTTMGMCMGGGKFIYKDSTGNKNKKGVISLSKGGNKPISLSKGGTKKLTLTTKGTTRMRNRKRK